jgi:hypothetical protein
MQRAIQQYLGHRSIASTMRYTALAPERFKGFWKDWGMADKVSREPPVAGMAYVADRVVQLLSDLNRASSAVPVGVTVTPERERRRYIFVLTHLSKFVQEIGGTSEQSRYISDLALALNDLDLGVVHPVLKSCEYGSGKRGDVSKLWRARGRVATGLEALIRSGMSRPEAAKSALKDFPHIKHLMTAKSKNPVSAVLSWNDDFCRGSGKSRIKNREWADTLEVGTEFLNLCAGRPDDLKRLARNLFHLASRI